MEILLHHSYNLDLLNLLNIVAGDAQYQSRYPQIYSEFGQPLSLDACEILQQVSRALGTTFISAPVAFVLSIVPQFDKAPLLDLMLTEEGLLAALEEHEPRLLPQKDQLFLLFQVLAPVIQEIELLGFRDYWLTEQLPSIEGRLDEIEDTFYRSDFIKGIHDMFKKESLPEEIHIFLCALNAQHGVRLTRHSCMVDISFTNQKIIDFALHEVFQSALIGFDISTLLQPLVDDPFLQLAFEKSKSATGFENVEVFIQENVVEAAKVYLLFKNGYQPDPYGYLQSHLQGALVLAVVLLAHLEGIPDNSDALDEILKNWMDQKPVGNLMTLYRQAVEQAGKEIGEM